MVQLSKGSASNRARFFEPEQGEAGQRQEILHMPEGAAHQYVERSSNDCEHDWDRLRFALKSSGRGEMGVSKAVIGRIAETLGVTERQLAHNGFDSRLLGCRHRRHPIPDGLLTGLKTTAPDESGRAGRTRACRNRAFVPYVGSSAPAIDYARAVNRRVAPRTAAESCCSSRDEAGKDNR